MIDEKVLKAAQSVGRQLRVRQSIVQADIDGIVAMVCEAQDVEGDQAVVGQLGRWLSDNLRAIDRDTEVLVPILDHVTQAIDRSR